MINEKNYSKRDFASKLKKTAYYESLLRTSWNYQATQFFENSTLHGVRYIAEKGRPFLEKFIWFCCVTIGAIATMIIIVSLWGKFQTNPTITGLDTDFHNWDVAFPALTLCEIDPSNESYIDDAINKKFPGDYSPDLKKEFFKKLSQLNYDNMLDFKKYAENADFQKVEDNLKDLIYSVVSHCEDIILECKWKDETYNCCSGFFPVFTEHGFCYTFNSRHYEKSWPWLEEKLPKFQLQYIQETDIKWSFYFGSVSPKMLIFIHNSDEVPSIDTNPQHVWDQKVNKISFSMKQTYTTSDAKQLSIRQRHCIFEDEVKLKTDKTMYTYTACTQQCRMETAKKLCGCVPHFYPVIEGFTHCKLKELTCIADNLKKIINIEGCGCELGCSNTVYEVEKLSEQTEETSIPSLESEFVSWPMVRYKREVLFGWVDLLVSFGGIAGLFLGFSLLSGVEIIYYFTIRACCMVYREKDEVEKIKLENSQKEKPNYDLSLTPYYKKIPSENSGLNLVLRKEGVFIPKDVLFKPVNNRINPLVTPTVMYPRNLQRIKREEVFHPPFGIEFLN